MLQEVKRVDASSEREQSIGKKPCTLECTGVQMYRMMLQSSRTVVKCAFSREGFSKVLF